MVKFRSNKQFIKNKMINKILIFCKYALCGKFEKSYKMADLHTKGTRHIKKANMKINTL